jgi:ATP-dependent DNA helicase RecG
MLWRTTDLTNEQVAELLALQESHFLDFKDKRGAAKAAKSVSAFANADGGDLYVGIGDHSEPNRLSNLFANVEEANGLITTIMGQFQDGPEYISCQFLNLARKGLCAAFTIQKTPFVVETPDGKTFKRQNAQDREIKTAHDLLRLQLEKGVRSFEDSTVEAQLPELDNSRIMKTFMDHVVPTTTKEVFLERERLTTNGNLRACALLLFDDNPQSLLPHAAVKIYRYKSLAEEGEREDLEGQPTTIEGPIYDVIRDAVVETTKIIESIPMLGSEGLVSVKYPAEAIHEVICNAILHRDYSIHDYVHIRVFDNRVEVESPGKLAGPVTVQNILKQRFARNKKVVRLTAKFPSPPNKDVGEGLNTTFRSMQRLNLGKPEIEETEASVIVRLKHQPLASKEDIIRKYLRENETISNTIARRICNVQSDSVIRKMFHAMINAGIIEKVPGTRGTGTKYRLVVSK